MARSRDDPAHYHVYRQWVGCAPDETRTFRTLKEAKVGLAAVRDLLVAKYGWAVGNPDTDSKVSSPTGFEYGSIERCTDNPCPEMRGEF